MTQKFITVTEERFKELEDIENRSKENEPILQIQVITRYHACGERPNVSFYHMRVAEMQIRNGENYEINEAIRFNREQIEEMGRMRKALEEDRGKLQLLNQEYRKMCDRNGDRLSKIPKWIRRIFKAV